MVRESKTVTSLPVWAPLLWGPSLLLEVRPILSSQLQQPRRPAAARPPCEAYEAFRGRISRTKRNADQTPTPARIAPKTALTESRSTPRAALAPPAAKPRRPSETARPWDPFKGWPSYKEFFQRTRKSVMMRTQAILKFSLGPFFQRVGKVVMMRAQAPLGFPLWPFFQRLWKSVMMRAQAVLESSPIEFFQRTPKSVMMRTRRPRMSLRIHRIRGMLLCDGAQAQNRWPQKRRIGGHNGKVD